MKQIIFISIVLSVMLVISCDSKLNMDSLEPVNQEMNVGDEHNDFLKAVISSIKSNGETRGIDSDATVFTNHMVDVEVEVMKAFKKSGITDKSKVDKFVQETLDYTLDQDILRVKNEASGNMSLTTILSQVYGDDFSSVLKGYTADMDNLFAQNLENVQFTNKASIIKMNWYRQGNSFERKAISAASSVASGSVDYWLNNAPAWNEQAKTWSWAFAKRVLYNVARTDFCTALAFCTKLKGATAALWKEVAITAGVASAIDGIATLIFDSGIIFSQNAVGENICIIKGEEMKLSDLKSTLYSEYLLKVANEEL